MREGGIQLNLRYLRLSGLGLHPQVTHAFSTRRGGVSGPPFSSLNLSLEVGDDQSFVQENRTRLLSDLGIGDRPLAKVRQVHGEEILVIDEEVSRRPGFPEELLSHSADALITALPGIILTISVADCVPLLLFDRAKRVIAAVHAGWRSTSARLTEKVIRRMGEDFGTHPEDFLAAIGPSIGICCYEVDEPVVEAFSHRFPDWQSLVREKDKGRWHLDLSRANQVQLTQCGVPPESIFSVGYCVSCHPELFFSHRRDGKRTGRMMGLVMLRDEHG
ncbi:MAG: peptidoglycan editing factor PgeF [candidate division NC10 bacterium]|nr:peptidoglycan editing factor PgeF [candidate division NC10 bacterium]